MNKDILLTFTGFHDPYFKGLIDPEEQKGPILTLLSVRFFKYIFLFSTPLTEQITEDTKEAIETLYPNTQIFTFKINVIDPTNYFEILKGLSENFKRISGNFDNSNYFIAVASGTPQMHACWILLTSAGIIPAKILHIRPPRFVTKDSPLVEELNLDTKDFPVVRFPEKIQIGITENISQFESSVKILGIVGDHKTMHDVLKMIAMLAPSVAPILILGETGTGKELFARLIHRLSGRQNQNFIPINCAAIPEQLVESILFGHKKGAFTGAITDQIGKFEQADKGTLFLDELGELPLSIQAKLLRVLQDGVIEPVGANKTKKVDVRIIAATNKDLRKLIKKGKFREDLYYRLNVGEIRLPSLRERKSDIPKLSLHILDKINASLKKPKRLSVTALNRLQNHSWPGNIRDLENVIERSVRLCSKEVIEEDDLLIMDPIVHDDPLDFLPIPHDGFSLEEFLSCARKQLILKALDIANGNQSEAARLLGITPQAVHKFFKIAKV